jgi:hypothetical protein
VHRHAREALQVSADWKPFRHSVSVRDLLDLLLLMASTTSSLYATVRRFFTFSHETASRAVKANLPTQDRLVLGLLKALHRVAALSRLDRKRGWTLAIDTHDIAYYGQRTPQVIGGPKKQGTQWFYGYASAVLLHKRQRYTVAFAPLSPGQKPHDIVQLLLDQVAQKGLKVQGVALDSAFDSGETLLLLQRRDLGYIVPLRRKGNDDNPRNRCFEGRHKQIRWTEWTTKTTYRRVQTRVVLWKGSRRTMAFAFGGWSGERAQTVHQQAAEQRQTYRRRFGIETSYRQKNQAQARTTSRRADYRLLLEGLGHLLRQVWVALTEQIAKGQHLGVDAWIGVLTLEILLDWLADEVADHYHEERSIPLSFKKTAKASQR